MERLRSEAGRVSQEFENRYTGLQAELERERATAAELQARLARRESEAAAELSAAQGKLQELQSAIGRLEEEKRNRDAAAAAENADIRKQNAFMRKNTAAMKQELDWISRIAESRRRKLIALTVITIGIVASWIMSANLSCRQSASSAITGTPSATGPDQKTAAHKLPPADSGKAVRTGSAGRRNPKPEKHPGGGTAAAAWPQFRIAGVKTSVTGKSCKLIFDNGVFSTWTTVTPDALKQLKEIAAAIRPHIKHYKLIVEGHTDDRPLRDTSEYDGNDALALARAEVIRKLLITEGGIPPAAVTARHAGGRPAPYPNNTALNRKRNRTVVIYLVMK